MNLLYQNRGSEDQAFIKFVCEDVLSQVCKNKAKNNSFAGIFVDGRNREINSLEDFACFHSFYTYSEYAYPIFVFVKNTKNFNYTYLLKNGISNVRGGIKVLKDMNYPQEIIDNSIA